MCIAETVFYLGKRKIGGPVIMDGCPLKLGEYIELVHGFLTTPLMDPVEGSCT
jgi:hypothetical protein